MSWLDRFCLEQGRTQRPSFPPCAPASDVARGVSWAKPSGRSTCRRAWLAWTARRASGPASARADFSASPSAALRSRSSARFPTPVGPSRNHVGPNRNHVARERRKTRLDGKRHVIDTWQITWHAICRALLKQPCFTTGSPYKSRVVDQSLFKPKFVLSLVGRAIVSHSTIFLSHVRARGGVGGRVGEDSVVTDGGMTDDRSSEKR